MTISGPRVLDFTDGRQRLGVEVLAAPAFEILVQLFVFASGADEADEFGVGPEWFARVREASGEELVARMESLGCCGQIWAALLGDAYDTPHPRTVEALLAHLRSSDAVELRTRLLRMLHVGGMDQDDLRRRAAAGDLEAYDALEAEHADPGLRELIADAPDATKATLVDTLEQFDRRVFRGGGEVADVLRRDAAEKTAMARSMSAERLVETATNGITFSMQPEVSGVVLIPSVALRPFVLISAHGSLRIFVYGVSEEVLSADPSTPPAWLVGFYKALGDERRLRILNLLAEGPASFGELTERLGLAKSTVHHHLRTLRQAGLIRVVVGDDKEYQLRTDAVPEAGRLLESYLRSPGADAAETEGHQR